MGVAPTPLRVIENDRKSLKFDVWIIDYSMEKEFLKNKFFLNITEKIEPPSPHDPRSTQKCSQKMLFLFLGHVIMLFDGKGSFNKQQTLNFADIKIRINKINNCNINKIRSPQPA